MSYPTLRLGVLQGLAELKANCDADQSYLRKTECPYDIDTIKMIEKLFKPIEIEVIKEVVVDKPSRGQVGRPSKGRELNDDDAAEVEQEAREMLTELRQLDKQADGEMKQLDTATRLSILKTRAQLMEKLVSIRERFTSVRKVIEFQKVVVSILDDIVEEDKRDEFLKRLEQYL
jgi:hypothetical protein